MMGDPSLMVILRDHDIDSAADVLRSVHSEYPPRLGKNPQIYVFFSSFFSLDVAMEPALATNENPLKW